MMKLFMYKTITRPLAIAALMSGAMLSQQVNAATLKISTENKAGQPVSGFRYIIEEDVMYKPTLGLNVQVPANNAELANSLAFNFHKSHSPVALNAAGEGLSGQTGAASIDVEVPDGNYFVSILPYNDHQMGGAAVKVAESGQNLTADASVVVRVNDAPIPTAQISIQVFEDSSPINGAIDLGERGLNGSTVDGQFVPFHVILEDPAGQYGAGGGRVAYDAYGNPLGTDYDANGNVISSPTGTDTNGVNVSPGTLPVGAIPLVPNDEGYLVIKHLPPGKYGVQIVPPAGGNWIQTSTIEGTKVVDAWVKANEPQNFVEFGPPGPHVFIGFTREFDCNAGTWGDDTSIDLLKTVSIDGQDVEVEQDDPDLNPCIGYNAPAAGVATVSVTGSVVDNHMSRSPDFTFNNGTPFPGCRVAVNLGIAGKTIYSGKCFDDDTAGLFSAFDIKGLPADDYSLSIWDDGLDAVIANHPFSIAAGATPTDPLTVTALNVGAANPTNGTAANVADCTDGICELNELPVFNWFHKLYTSVFYDRNEDGLRTCNTTACDDPSQDDVYMNADSFANNIRWRDGRIYQSFAIDVEGQAPFDQVFPFFHWLVAETDFAKFKATGATIIVDNGGSDANLQANGYVPQPQLTDSTGAPLADCAADANAEECTIDGESLTIRGPALTFGMQGFLGQKSVIEYGKTNYGENENGGISGMAVYAITRAEHDVRYAAAEIWEPGIPRVQFALYQDDNIDEIADDLDNSGDFTPADVDNYPLNWFGVVGGSPGPEDIDHNGNNTFDYGDAIDVTWSDSWDDSLPEGCQGQNRMYYNGNASTPIVADDHCMDGMRNWNQVRPGVYDGGYAFPSNPLAWAVLASPDGNDYLKSGYYIVQGFAPQGYKPLKTEDKNVDFGDTYSVPQLLPPICAGDEYVVPDLLTFATDANGVQVVNGDPADLTPHYAGQTRKMCDKKHVLLTDGRNSAADFHFFTDVPKASHVVGGILNDLANEFNPNSPTFGEKFAPPWLPVAFYDWTGKEVTRVYADQYGKYNAMVPSTFTANAASPSGFTPNMLTACMNDGGYIDHDNNPATPAQIDPNYNPQYTQFCYTFQYMPGATTYLDTPVLQLAAFAGSGMQLDCEAADVTPMISSVTAPGYVGPYIPDASGPDLDGNNSPISGTGTTVAQRTLTINSVGLQNVLNPSSDEFTNKFVERNYGFGTMAGSVYLTDEAGDEYDATLINWSEATIEAEVPAGIPEGRYQLKVVNANLNASPMAVSVLIGALEYGNNVVHQVYPSTSAGAAPIQQAIDDARRGDLILVAPGVYDEMVILWKPVFLQGAGAFSTTINARAVPMEKVENWKAKMDAMAGTQFDVLPGQEGGALLFDTSEGSGITVVGKIPGNLNTFNNGRKSSGIDGFTITGASTGGGIFLNGYINGMDISNNRITGNEGTFGGGIRMGHPALIDNNQLWTDALNRDNRIYNNQIIRNGTQNGVGGGIALYNGSNNYRITDNLICGNFAATDGAGIGHLGKSTGGRIEGNQIIFNQSFRQTPGFETDGGGILIAGQDPAPGATTTLTDGSGHVYINRNLIQGNQAGAGDGGGIALRRVNGADVDAEPGTPNKWWLVSIDNNTIVNNVTGLAGGAIAMKDALRVDIENNTIANNVSTATAGGAFALGFPSASNWQIAGVASYHLGSTTLKGLSTHNGARWNKDFTNPLMQSNILWNNQSYTFLLSDQGNLGTDCGGNVLGTLCIPSQLLPVTGYTDYGVVKPVGNETLDQIRWSTVSADNATLFPNGWNISKADPGFVEQYLNGAAVTDPSNAEFQTIMVAPALDEGGNWIDARYAPLSINDVDGLDNGINLASDYHLNGTSTVIDGGNPNRDRPAGLLRDANNNSVDIDGDSGTQGTAVDQGSDEVR